MRKLLIVVLSLIILSGCYVKTTDEKYMPAIKIINKLSPEAVEHISNSLNSKEKIAEKEKLAQHLVIESSRLPGKH